MPSNTTRPAVMARARPQVDDPVRVRHHGLVMLDHDHRLPRLNEPVQQAKQLLDIRQMQARRWLVEHVNVTFTSHIDGKLQALPLSPGQSGERLAQLDIIQPHV